MTHSPATNLPSGPGANVPHDPAALREHPAVKAVYAGASLSHAAAQHGVKSPTLNRWVNIVRAHYGDEGLPDAYLRRSRALVGRASPLNPSAPHPVYNYPVVARVPAGGFNGAPIPEGDRLGTYTTDLNIPARPGRPRPFAFKVHGDSMTNPAAAPNAPAADANFPSGTLVLCDPATFPDPGDFVVVLDATDESMTLKKLVNRSPEGRDLWLTPLNPAFSPIQYDDAVHQLVGVVVDAMMPMYRKPAKTGRRCP